jgi:4-amino-4-deoxy-L-arabinose transferase-like glycosyltransferase
LVGAPLKSLLRLLTGPAYRPALVLGLAFVLFTGTDQDGASFSGDTARYALIGREIVERGDPTRLTLEGEPYANKPPLIFWLEAAAFSAFGFTEAAARLPSRAFGLASVALLMSLVARHGGRRIAFFAGIVMATWHAFQRSAITCRLDSALTFFTLASIAVFLSIDRKGAPPRRAILLGAVVGLGVLTKGPAGLLGAGAILLGAPLAGRGRLLLRSLPLAAAALVAVAAPWYVLQVAREGEPWISGFLKDITRSKEVGLDRVLGLYAREFFLTALPWLPPAFLGAAAAAARLRKMRRRALPEALLLSLITVLCLGVASRGTHHARYLIPAVPALAWFAGAWLAPRLRAPWIRRSIAGAIAATVLIAYPLSIAFGLFPVRDKYREMRAAVEIARAAVPDASILPTWPPRIGSGTIPPVRFYFGLSLRPFNPGDRSQPPFVLLRDRSLRAELEAVAPLLLVFEGREHMLYRRR